MNHAVATYIRLYEFRQLYFTHRTHTFSRSNQNNAWCTVM